jgi:ribosomal protein S18 acetylase RimI-like enzyme
MGLCMQKDNARAIRFYERAGFGGNLEPFVDKSTGVEYRRMALVLNPEGLLRIRDGG